MQRHVFIEMIFMNKRFITKIADLAQHDLVNTFAMVFLPLLFVHEQSVFSLKIVFYKLRMKVVSH